MYDNLGLETAWKVYDTILVSDGGGKMAPDPEPHTDWVRHALRINDLIDNQVRSLRKRQVIGSFTERRAEGDLLGYSQRHRGLSGRRLRCHAPPGRRPRWPSIRRGWRTCPTSHKSG